MQTASLVLAISVVALGAMTLRAVREGRSELEASEASFDRGDLQATVLHARRAATAYAPGAPHTERALARLRAVAVGAEAASDIAAARLAWGAIRSAALETRHVTVPYAAELAEANERLERLALRQAGDPEAEGGATRRIRAALAEVPGPSPWASGLLASGFALSLAGLGVIAVRGVTRAGRLVRGPFSTGAVLFVAGALLWAFAVYRA